MCTVHQHRTTHAGNTHTRAQFRLVNECESNQVKFWNARNCANLCNFNEWKNYDSRPVEIENFSTPPTLLCVWHREHI